MKSKHFISIIFIFCFTLFRASSQDITYTKFFEEKDGLNYRIINDIVEGGNGEFYLLCDQVIQQFDGRDFSNVDLPASYKKHHDIQFVFDHHTDPIVVIDNCIIKSIVLNQYHTVSLSKSGIVPGNLKKDDFISGNQKQLFLFRKNDNNSYDVHDFITQKLLLRNLFLKNKPRHFYFDQKSKLFAYLNDDDRINYIGEQAELNNFPTEGRLSLHGNSLILYNRSGIYRFNTKDFEQIFKLDKSDKVSAYWSRQDQSGNTLLTYKIDFARVEDIYLINESGEVQRYNKLLQTNNNIKQICADNFKEKALLATYNGLYFVEFRNQAIQALFKKKTSSESAFGYVILGITYIESLNTLFFAPEMGQLFAYKDGVSTQLDKNDPIHNTNNIIQIKGSNKIACVRFDLTPGEAPGILSVYNITTGKFKHIPLDFTPQTARQIDLNTILVVGFNRNTIANARKGNAVYVNPHTGALKPVNFPKNVLSNDIRVAYYDDTKKQTWLGTTDGLYCLDKNLKTIQRYDNLQKDNSAQIKQPHIRLITKLNDKIYVGTLRDGLYIIDYHTQRIIKHISEDDGLSDEAVISAELDKNNNIWLGTFKGVTVLNADHNIIDKIYAKDGLANNENNTISSTQDELGQLYFGSINGISKINPDRFKSIRSRHNINITSIDAIKDNNVVQLDVKERTFNLSEKTNAIELRFNIPDFYKYFFTNDGEFLDITYSNNKNNKETQFKKYADHIEIIHPVVGKHHLRLQFKPEFGNEITTEPIEFTFVIKRDYRPIIIILSGILLFTGITLLFARLKIRSNKLLEQEKTEYNKKLADMQLTALRSQMNPHFIFNALGAIQYFINTHDKKRADDYLSKFAKLMRSILEASKSDFITLQDEIKMLKLYTSLEQIRFEDKFNYSFEIDEDIDLTDFELPSMIIQPFVENAINHGLYHLDAKKGKLEISFTELEEDIIRCRITDNGVGRKTAQALTIKKKHKSRGMQIVNERIEALRMRDSFDIQFNITDLNEDTTGTLVDIIIKRKA